MAVRTPYASVPDCKIQFRFDGCHLVFPVSVDVRVSSISFVHGSLLFSVHNKQKSLLWYDVAVLVVFKFTGDLQNIATTEITGLRSCEMTLTLTSLRSMTSKLGKQLLEFCFSVQPEMAEKNLGLKYPPEMIRGFEYLTER
jgi:hypothetical protein